MPLFNFSSSTRSLLSNRSLRSGQQRNGSKHHNSNPRGATNGDTNVKNPPSGNDSSRCELLPTQADLPIQTATIESTPEARKVMRHISALGMEDPVTLKGSNDRLSAPASPRLFKRSGSTKAREVPVKEHPSLIFEDMALEDLPQDMKSLISVASDHTANSEKGVDMELFHSSLGHLSAANFDLPGASANEIEACANVGKISDSSDATEESVSSSQCENNDDPRPIASSKSSMHSKFVGVSISKLPVGAKRTVPSNQSEAEIYKTLGDSFQSLQSLSLEELQYLNAATFYDGNSSRSLLSRSRASCQCNLHVHQCCHNSSPASLRLHQSCPRSMNQSKNAVAGGRFRSEAHRRDSTSTSRAHAVPSRPYTNGHKREWQAPPFVGSFCDKDLTKSPPHKRAAAPTVAAVMVPRRRRLPSIAQLFPDDGRDGVKDPKSNRALQVAKDASHRRLVSPHDSFSAVQISL